MAFFKGGLLDGKEIKGARYNEKLKDRFIVPPFTILKATSGYWQTKKKELLKIGIESEVGRDENITMLNQKGLMQMMKEDKNTGKKIEEDKIDGKGFASGTSIFDPVLCKLAYRWFCPINGKVLDPFCGGSVRGIIAAEEYHPYFGIDLSARQIQENKKQLEKINIKKQYEYLPEWVVGDSLYVDELYDDKCDFIFTCPPYGDLEVYSKDPRDISNMSYDNFLKTYREIIFKSCEKLKENRFACVVVGDFRNKDGHSRGFQHATYNIFTEVGLILYNEAILTTSVGSLMLRIDKQFTKNRKLGSNHQYVMVFYKGMKPNTEIRKDFDIEVGFGIPEAENSE